MPRECDRDVRAPKDSELMRSGSNPERPIPFVTVVEMEPHGEQGG